MNGRHQTNKSFTIQQETAHSIIHALAILFGMVGIPVLIALAAIKGNNAVLAAACVYGFCFLLQFTSSTLYHAIQQPQAKRVLEILDHISIYFLIAGTYTPFLLIYFNNSFGMALLLILWALTLLGTCFKLFFTGRFEILSIAVYVLMGWILVAGGRRFFVTLPGHVLSFVVVGGCLYSAGIVFYLWQRLSWHHAAWHCFVLAAAVCHYVAILLSV